MSNGGMEEDSQPQQQPQGSSAAAFRKEDEPQRLDGKSFLDHLRDSSGALDHYADYSPDATLNADNRSSQQQHRFEQHQEQSTTLEGLFEEPTTNTSSTAAPPPPPPSSGSSIVPPLSNLRVATAAAPVGSTTTTTSTQPPVMVGAPRSGPAAAAAPAPPKPSHNRNVSWGANIEHHAAPLSPSTYASVSGAGGIHGAKQQVGGAPPILQRPALNKTTTYPNHNNMSVPPPSPPLNQQQQQQHQHRRDMSALSDSLNSPHSGGVSFRKQANIPRLTVEEVSPFEAEVETAILKALDDRAYQSTRRLRTDTGDNSTLLSHVADQQHQSDSLDETINSVVSPTPSGEEKHRHANDGRDDSLRSSSGSGSGTNTASSRNDPAHIVRPLLARNRTGGGRSSRHARQESVEQTLFDLTMAMTALHKRKKSKTAPSHRSQPSSSAEEFAQNAMLLADSRNTNEAFAQQQQPATSPAIVGAHKNRSRWGIVKDNLPVLREDQRAGGGESGDDDDDDVNENGAPAVDLEVGGTSLDQESNSHDDDDDLQYSHHSSDEDSYNGNNGKNSHGGTTGNSKNNTTGKDKTRRKHHGGSIKVAGDKFKEDWQKWSEFFRPHRGRFFAYCKNVILYLLVPLISVAAILFYLAGNVPTGTSDENRASASYILLFCARQIITLSMALAIQCVIIDIIALQTRLFLSTVGPVITLLIVQSKGWPHILFWWSVANLAMNYGDGAFAHHWGFYQDWIDLFNKQNPSGSIPSNVWYEKCLVIGVSVSLVVAIKRFLVGLYLGRKQFSHYGEQLAKVMNKMLVVSEVAALAKFIEKAKNSEHKPMSIPSEIFSWNRDEEPDGNDGDTVTSGGKSAAGASIRLIDPNRRDPLTGSLHFSEKLKLMQLLEQWEEPERQSHASNEIASISAVLRFRKALTFIQQRYPFSFDFGPADTREACIESSQKVYNRLLGDSTEPVLQFETIALVALDDDKAIDQQKAKALIKLFRPDRDGKLTMLDFVKSVDTVYKEYRLLQATIDNSARIDQSFENLFNVVFYILVVTIILSQLGFDPFALFLSLSSVILAFAFMIGSASSKYFEGVLFILARRPYGIGDKISVSNNEEVASLHGALPWVVENVTLFETVVCFLPTNERASLSNGALANSRIINWARSPMAQFHVFLNFPLDTPYEKIEIFKTAIEEYMKARPREWRALNGFRANRVVANENYIEWLIVIQHREAWQEVGQVLDSKANLNSYCQEVARQLKMEYQAPRLPVELQYAPSPLEQPLANETESSRSLDRDALTQEFQSIARNKHNIRVC